MCNNDAMMRMSSLEDQLLSMLEAEAAKGLESINAEEMGEVVDMVKDLGEAKYYCSIVMAMQEEYEPMGYSPSRRSDGRYAPKGHGMGYDRMEEPRGMGRMDQHGYGSAYDRYQSARMGYQSHSTAENRRMMEQTADEHMREFEESLREIWDEADQHQRNKIKGALVNMANGLK